MTDSIIAARERERAELLARYGTGSRPSWVSAELAILGQQIDMRRQQLEQEAKTTVGVRETPER